MPSFQFDQYDLPPHTEALRQEVREFLAVELEGHTPRQRAETWNGLDAQFSRKLGARGWIAMTWPKRYGGHERSAFDRYVVCEELLAAGAPVAYHWIADRQSGPLLLRFGTDEQRERILPRVARGELCLCIGMSEPDSGSDLASLRTRATRTDGGWVVNGRKVWTTYAHEAQYMIALFRTEPVDPAHRHAGLSQFLVDMSTPGISLSPIYNMVGEHHFNEVILEDVFVPDSALVGTVGDAWRQVNAELAYERSGPERYLSSNLLLQEMVREAGKRAQETDDRGSERTAVELGRLIARQRSLRRMSISVAGMLEAGESPLLESAVVKSLGVEIEQELPQIAHDLLGAEQMGDHGTDYQQVLAYLTQSAVSFSLRGGTPEIMRGIIARGLGLR
jgi:acyl-CoA dehydrogenase